MLFCRLLFGSGVLVFATACSSAGAPAGEVGVSDLTEDGGDAQAPNGDAGTAAREVIPSFLASDVGDRPKIRFAIDDGAAVTAVEAALVPPSSGGRKVAVQGLSPVSGGKPAIYLEVGRAGGLGLGLEVGTYDCAHNDGFVMLVLGAEKQMTGVKGGASRPCSIVIEHATSTTVMTGPLGMRSVVLALVGRFEAVVGARDDAASPTHVVRGAFATRFTDFQLPPP